ncbi:ATP-binding cassette domain-containing protein [Pararhodobacter zhoushanensis]|uniref:ATP-binding cassette domain-containing protein n=1 Tax=Pararhodobacter zhoushanensis TaxID=2479545 RepID=A0ABT3H4F5_9RHOB|nr:ATP-binding cassette domain-containing protein [Pararhodobacter zhoushanensis]MCW1934588.1 ATP-binding cassette domain-containing protein [Pararhodobacter zhoushanensis]
MERNGDSAPLLVARGLGKSFGAVRVLHDLDFEVRQGEVLGILGPNGAGKTTLFNLVSGDIRDHAGEIRFRGRPLAGPRSAVRGPGSGVPIRSRFPMPA